MTSTTWVGAYLVLCWLLQMIFELTNQQFFLLFVIGAALIFIITSLTHTHDVDAEEIALKAVDKAEESIHKIAGVDGKTPLPQVSQKRPSGHKAPEGF